MRIWLVVLALGSVLAACGGKDAAQTSGDPQANGFVPPVVISRVDWASRAARRFRRLDKNADDKLDPTEIPKRAGRLMALDHDGDGSITEIEFGEGMLARFDTMDLNHDKTLTSDERQEAKAAS